MSKPTKYYLEGKNNYLWKYEEQTRVKHRVVIDYFKLWAKILGQYYTVCYFDCFGGCGAYLHNEDVYYGFPFLAAEVATELNKTLGRNIKICVIEPNSDNFENLKKVKNELSNKLTVVPDIAKMTFESYINHKWTIRIYRDPQNPVFFFIDPFGYSLNFSNIEDIMKYPKNEMVINYMYDYISRFINTLDNPKLESTYDRFFGCREWRNARSLSGIKRENEIIDIYKRQLKKLAICFPL